ncbi:hypothetical protein P3T27_002507 [Kitasatospora sp. MAA19]|uniref:hypothetical protein n=1 Tax=Kitasatospora sp. MAA19 TaxID=3035090 RepID=UPI0024755296|nr:hypothetical protein [Kitasatospora sp. MAA19]MDH6705785.1 hypothetical protein [Kitasatospora sp. MAA19]
MSRPTVQRSDLAGWAGYGYCALHSRFFWGLRLHPGVHPDRDADHVGTGQPEDRRARGPRRDAAMLEVDPDLVAQREGILSISDKGFASKPFEKELADQGIQLLRASPATDRV